MYDTEKIKEYLKENLSKKRYTHSLNVADECRNMAEIYGEDVEKCYFAGLVHDICKEIPAEKQREMVLKSHRSVSMSELSSKQLWHAIAGAWYVENELGIKDNDIINAVRFHTIARAGMSRTEEIVYLGDLVSADRTFKDVKRMRKLAYSDINKAMLEALRFSVQNVVEKCGYLPNYTIEAYNQYVFLRSER
ncbi:MAG: bis(5'-nucleosyl)-tetraphosphatase (symmetrical) YqeK [Oscillospiraceae bacterium]